MAGLSIVALVTKLLSVLAGMFVTAPVFHTSVMPEDIIVDFIVVGSGSAGSAIAGRLSEVAEWDVLVFETGGQPQAYTVVPQLHFVPMLGGSADSYNYPVQPAKSYGKSLKQERYYRGKVIGGSSTINQMMYHRGNPRDYDNWAEQGNEGWDYETVLKYYKRMENYKGHLSPSNAPYRGTEGPISVEKVGWVPPVGKVVVEAGREMGLDEIDYNAGRFIGTSFFQFTMKNGERVSSADAYLKPNLHRRNLKLQINSQVIEILFNDENRAIGVKYIHDNKVKRAFAQKEVILSAGAADSPKLLMLSGIGPREHLHSLGIKVRADVPGVGQNYQDHVSFSGLYWTIHPNVSFSFVSRFSLEAQREYFEKRKGPYSVPYPICSMFSINTGSSNYSNIPDIQIYFLTALYGSDFGIFTSQIFKDSVSKTFFRQAHGKDGYLLFPTLMRPKSRGSITLRSKNPSDPPVIDPKCLSHPDDLAVLVAGARAAFKIGNVETLQKKLGAKPNTAPLPGCEHLEHLSDAYWECLVRDMSHLMSHMTSTCKMAPDSDPNGVVSPRLEVRGVQNLRVVDASIMPDITSGNTNAPAIMIGERGADLIKEDYGKLYD